MLVFVTLWLTFGLGLEVSHQVNDPAVEMYTTPSRVIMATGRVVAWPGALVSDIENRDE